MGIERMVFVEISGGTGRLDDVLERCLASGMFQPENAARLSEYSVGTASLPRNPYGGLLVKAGEIAAQMGIVLHYTDSEAPLAGDERGAFPEQANEYLDRLRQAYARCSAEESRKLADREQEALRSLYCRIKFLNDAYDLRKYTVSLRGVFHVVGFVLGRNKAAFLSLFEALEDVRIKAVPAQEETRLKTPVRLRNNWFVRPFEMFVNMYGAPSYNDIDPTPFVAYTYTLLFGIMFGDLGQGLCISLLGLFLSRAKGIPLGGVMSRIGLSSACFGVLYGSVFGFEHLLDPLYQALGFHEKPIEVMQSETTTKILLAAVGLGAAIIVMVILFNICIGIKHRDLDRTLLSHNGLAGLVFYCAVLYAAVRVATGAAMPGTLYMLLLVALPLLVIFLREPILRLIGFYGGDTIIHRHRTLKESTVLKKVESGIRDLFATEFVAVRFGRIPTDSYQKLHFYREEPFLLYPLKSDREYIWCIYAMAVGDKPQIDAIFHDLYFERFHIPQEDLESAEKTEAFFLACINYGDKAAEARQLTSRDGKPLSRRKTVRQCMFPDGVGGFVTESFFELFEVLLSFVTNTMSFLRVGGFILSHAGMMSVVFTLSSMVGGGAGPVVIVVGNLFVMGMEGLIVGIQALRLEFYEMFSRFFDADGDTFSPVYVNY